MTPETIRDWEKEIKEILLGSDVDYRISLLEKSFGEVTYSKPYQLHLKTAEALSLSYQKGVEETLKDLLLEKTTIPPTHDMVVKRIFADYIMDYAKKYKIVLFTPKSNE